MQVASCILMYIRPIHHRPEILDPGYVKFDAKDSNQRQSLPSTLGQEPKALLRHKRMENSPPKFGSKSSVLATRPADYCMLHIGRGRDQRSSHVIPLDVNVSARHTLTTQRKPRNGKKRITSPDGKRYFVPIRCFL